VSVWDLCGPKRYVLMESALVSDLPGRLCV
jgi:hypothetical protein